MPGSNCKYVIDSSALIDMKLDYAKDVLPGMWDKLGELAEGGILIAPEQVKFEIIGEKDDVAQWAAEHDEMFVATDIELQEVVREILAKSPSLNKVDQKICADPFVVALARVRSCAVVTHEKKTGNLHKQNIPDVCHELNVNFFKLLEMFRREGLRL